MHNADAEQPTPEQPTPAVAMTATAPTATMTAAAVPQIEQLALEVVAGPDRALRLPIPYGTVTVGKSSRCELTLSDSRVSRRHLQITRRASSLEVIDLDSRNGSFFRGARFERIFLGIGATITIGRNQLRVTAAAQQPPTEPACFGALLGSSPPMQQLFRLLAQAAPTPLPVLVQGETGTGKELVARALHQASGRTGPLVICDLAAISPGLIEGELFGYARGAFTGAERARAGVFEQADGGTLFLDEIGELGLAEQPRLLRALELGVVKRLGENHYRNTDVRVVAATNRVLAVEVEAGRFRADLFHRLASLCVALPPLRERREDIAELVRHFADAGPVIEPDAMAALQHHDWPGNVRELRNVIERAVALRAADGEPIDRQVLGLDEPSPNASPEPLADMDPAIPFKEAKLRLVDAWERQYVRALLQRYDGNVSLAARNAGMHRVHLHRLLKKYGDVE